MLDNNSLSINSLYFITLTIELQTCVLDMTSRQNVIHVYAKLFQNQSINDKVNGQISFSLQLTLKREDRDLGTGYTIITHRTHSHNGEHLSQIILNAFPIEQL